MIGISQTAAELWAQYDSASYNENFIESDNEGVWFTELPGWAYDLDEGPFYIDDEGAIFAISTRPSQAGILIGNML